MNSFTSFFTERFNTIQNYLQTQSFPSKEWLDLFTWQFWTEGGLGTRSEFSLTSYGLTLIFLVAILLLRTRLARVQRRIPVYGTIINHLTSIVVLIVVMAVFYGFARAEQIAYLSSRITILLTLVTLIVWIVWLALVLLRHIPNTRRAYLEKERFFRYLPKR